MAFLLSQIFKPRDSSKSTRFSEVSNCFAKGIRFDMFKKYINKNASHDLSIVKRLGED